MYKNRKVLKTILALINNSEKRKLCPKMNNVAATNINDIANGFNEFFVSIASRVRHGYSH